MNKKLWHTTLIVAGLTALLLLMSVAGWAAASWTKGTAPKSVTANTAFTYQGRLTRGGAPYSGSCHARFRLFSAQTGGQQTGATQNKIISPQNGLFTVALDFGISPFNGDARWLSIDVKCAGDADWVTLGRTRITATPYALYAFKAAKTEGYANVLVVAKKGGDATSVQAAINSIHDANWRNRYLVWVAPGIYTETVTLKPFVTLEGAGKTLTTIISTGSANVTSATITGAPNTTVRALTVVNASQSNAYASGIYVAGDPTYGAFNDEFRLEDVSIQATNVLTGTVSGQAIGLYARHIKLTLRQVSAQIFTLEGNADGMLLRDVAVNGVDTSWNVDSHAGGNVYGVQAQNTSLRMRNGGFFAQTSGAGQATAVNGTGTDVNFTDMSIGAVDSGAGGGALNLTSTPQGYNSFNLQSDYISAAYGDVIHVFGNTIIYGTIKNSKLDSNSGQAILLEGARHGLKMVLTEINGGASAIKLHDGATVNCFQVYNFDYTPVTCP